MIENFSYKKFFIDFGIFLGMIIICFLIIFYAARLSKKSWQKNLLTSIEQVLDENESNTWTVGNYVQINNPLALTTVCYEAQNRKTGVLAKVVLMRVQTFYGPLPAVFLVFDNKDVYFVGYSSLHGRIAKQLTNKPSDKRISYWKSKLLEIIE